MNFIYTIWSPRAYPSEDMMDIVVMIFSNVDGETRVCSGQPGGDAYTSTWHARIAIVINRDHQNPRTAVECRCGSRPRCDKSLINMPQGSVLNLDSRLLCLFPCSMPTLPISTQYRDRIVVALVVTIELRVSEPVDAYITQVVLLIVRQIRYC
jgi:hypothetical protein